MDLDSIMLSQIAKDKNDSKQILLTLGYKTDQQMNKQNKILETDNVIIRRRGKGVKYMKRRRLDWVVSTQENIQIMYYKIAYNCIPINLCNTIN